jgi:membrane protein implicated in regulation of membrane protease activity
MEIFNVYVSDWVLWLILLVIFLVIEIATLGLTTIWFAGGALVACIASLCQLSLPVQSVLFVIVSVVLLIFTRPVATRFFNRDRVRTNADSLIGQNGIVTEQIDNIVGHGIVCVNGQEWTARSADDSLTIEKGQQVEILEIRGVKLIVKQKMEG